MANSGDYINYANYKALDGSSWRYSTSIGSSVGTYTFYISAPCWYATYKITGSAPWGYQEGGFLVYPYDSTTGAFATNAVYGSSQSLRGSGNSYQWDFLHNYKTGNWEDIHDCHLWKLSVYHGDNDGSAEGTLYTGGLGCISEDFYNNYFKGRRIFCSKGDWWKKGNTYSSDEAFLQSEGYSCMRGTQISISTGTYKYITANHLA